MSEDVRSFVEQVKGEIALFGMLPQGGKVIAALSGGADSMALAHFLVSHTDVPVLAAHVNHGLRGAQSDADEEAVRRWCEENRIPLRVLRADVGRLARERGQGLEECGRNVRYAFFEELADGAADRIATAHTCSDNAETVLLNLTRGAGARGLCGIPPVRGRIVRPFLCVTREQVEAYCRFYRLPYVTDFSNADRRFARNRVRLDVIPALKAVNPAFEREVAGMAARLLRDETYLQGRAEQAVEQARVPDGYRLSVLAALPEPVLVRAAASILQRAGGVQPGSLHLEQAAAVIRAGRGGLSAPGGIQLAAQGNTLFVAPESAAPWKIPVQDMRVPLPDGRIVSFKKLTKKDIDNKNKFHNLLFHNCINYDTITSKLFFRNRRVGDVFRPAGRGVSKPLKKLFNEAKLEPLLRDRVLLLEDAGGILWMEGFGPCERARIPENAEQALLITVADAGEGANDKVPG